MSSYFALSGVLQDPRLKSTRIHVRCGRGVFSLFGHTVYSAGAPGDRRPQEEAAVQHEGEDIGEPRALHGLGEQVLVPARCVGFFGGFWGLPGVTDRMPRREMGKNVRL